MPRKRRKRLPKDPVDACTHGLVRQVGYWVGEQGLDWLDALTALHNAQQQVLNHLLDERRVFLEQAMGEPWAESEGDEGEEDE